MAYYNRSKMPELWDHQKQAIEQLRRGHAEGKRRQVLMMPTGSGKTLTSFDIVHGAMERNRRVMFICDRNSLITQTSENASRFGLEYHGIIQADHPQYYPQRNFQIASAQTLKVRGFPVDKPDLIIIDECHTVHKAINDYIIENNISCIGLTATPFTKGLGLLYDNLVNSCTMHQLTENGVLVPFKALACTPMDMTGAAMSGGEWTDKAIEERSLQIIGDAVKEWHEHAAGLKTILFASTIAECEAYTRAFNNSGVMSVAYTSHTPVSEGREIMDEYKKPNSEIQLLASVGRLTKGFDVPGIECGIDLRPLRKSFSEFVQKLGRVIRSAPGKESAIWLCHTGNFQRFQEDFEHMYFHGAKSLDESEKLDSEVRKEPKEKGDSTCPKCGYSPFFKRCMSCGHEKVSKALDDVTPGKMVEIRIGGKVAATDNVDLWRQLCTIAKDRGYKTGWAIRTYEKISGESFSKKLPYFEDVPYTPVSAATAGKVRSMLIAYRKAAGGYRHAA